MVDGAGDKGGGVGGDYVLQLPDDEGADDGAEGVGDAGGRLDVGELWGRLLVRAADGDRGDAAHQLFPGLLIYAFQHGINDGANEGLQ